MQERCCCGCFSITVGAQILAVLQAVGTTEALFYFFNPEEEFFTLKRAAILIAYSFQFISNVLVIFACWLKIADLMRPIIIETILADILLVFAYIGFLVSLFDHSLIPDDLKELKKQFPVLFVYIAIVLVSLGFGLSLVFSHWLFGVFKRCQKYIKEQERLRYGDQEALVTIRDEEL